MEEKTIKLKNIKRILVIKLREIGDLLLTVPVFTALKEHFPDSYISALVNSGTEDILTLNPVIDKVYVFDRTWKKLPMLSKIKKQLNFAWEIRKERFDLVIDFTSGDRAAIYSLISGAKERIVFKKDKGFIGKKYIYTHRITHPPIAKHEVEKNLDLVRPFGIDTNKKSPVMFYGKDDEKFILDIFNKNCIKDNDFTIHIHPTSKWIFKCLEDLFFARLIDYLQSEYNAKVILTCGLSNKENEKAKNIIRLCEKKPFTMIGIKTSLKHMAAISNNSDLFIGIDTGPMHIAASVKTPVIVFFGPSGSTLWGPWGENHTIIKNTNFECMPCGKDGCKSTKKSECLLSITFEMVKPKIDKAIKKILEN